MQPQPQLPVQMKQRPSGWRPLAGLLMSMKRIWQGFKTRVPPRLRLFWPPPATPIEATNSAQNQRSAARQHKFN